MYYFDRDFLKNYFYTGADVNVYANRDWYSVPAVTDMFDDSSFYGYDTYGKPRTIRYKDIEIVKSDTGQLDINGLQDVMSGNRDDETTADGAKDDKPDAGTDKELDLDKSLDAAFDPTEAGSEPDAEDDDKTTPKEAYDIDGDVLVEHTSVRVSDPSSEYFGDMCTIQAIRESHIKMIIVSSENIRHVGRVIIESLNANVKKL